jgi:hypothetical protein
MWWVVNITLRPPCHRRKISQAAIQKDTVSPLSARCRLRPLGMTPRIAQSVTQTLYLLSYTVSYLLLHDTCLKADLACCSNNYCSRWWLPYSGAWRRAIWYNFSPFRRNLLPPSEEVPPSRLCDVTGIVRSTALRTSIVAWCCQPFRRIIKWSGQVRSGQVTYIWAVRRSFPGVKGKIQFG